jgi:hypothetical protein
LFVTGCPGPGPLPPGTWGEASLHDLCGYTAVPAPGGMTGSMPCVQVACLWGSVSAYCVDPYVTEAGQPSWVLLEEGPEMWDK